MGKHASPYCSFGLDTPCTCPSRAWYWDAEGDPRHEFCGGEATFFETLTGEEVGMCLECSSQVDPAALIDGVDNGS